MKLTGIRVTVAGIGFALLATACGGASAGVEASPADEVAAEEVRGVLTQAGDSARTYGREHLGHYLSMTSAKLERAGLRIPDKMRLSVRTTHVGYCIKVRAESLSPSHAWAVATIDAKAEAPSPNDRCKKSNGA